MSGLLRLLSLAEACDSLCCGPECDRDPAIRLSTPIGGLDYCEGCIDGAVASLPEAWICQWEERQPVTLEADDGVPF